MHKSLLSNLLHKNNSFSLKLRLKQVYLKLKQMQIKE